MSERKGERKIPDAFVISISRCERTSLQHTQMNVMGNHNALLHF